MHSSASRLVSGSLFLLQGSSGCGVAPLSPLLRCRIVFRESTGLEFLAGSARGINRSRSGDRQWPGTWLACSSGIKRCTRAAVPRSMWGSRPQMRRELLPCNSPPRGRCNVPVPSCNRESRMRAADECRIGCLILGGANPARSAWRSMGGCHLWCYYNAHVPCSGCLRTQVRESLLSCWTPTGLASRTRLCLCVLCPSVVLCQSRPAPVTATFPLSHKPARVASLVGIRSSKFPPSHWRRLSRGLHSRAALGRQNSTLCSAVAVGRPVLSLHHGTRRQQKQNKKAQPAFSAAVAAAWELRAMRRRP